MAEITDEKIKKKHKEFNDRVMAVLNNKRLGLNSGLRRAVQRRIPRG